ncbi:MAG: 16S rRNA (guanine(966)-N(2))-methyltransferase RsmD [Clostridiales Family XIII bacterium]|nr:16S rRNA (guanine(966)-N(2))-methyltransferase RsmD [Clostridiales Family XIII bacterium]
MRVIAGIYKGRKLTPPKDDRVRPTTDRVKEAMFNLIAPYVPGANVLDLFAGSGALGIEALSRGAARVWLCDVETELTKANLSLLNIRENATVLRGDWRGAVGKIHEKIDLVLVDAPYDLCEHYATVLETLAASGALAEGAHAVIERDAKRDGYLQALPAAFALEKTRRYGKTAVDVLRTEGD